MASTLKNRAVSAGLLQLTFPFGGMTRLKNKSQQTKRLPAKKAWALKPETKRLEQDPPLGTPLSRDQELALIERYKNGDAHAGSLLVVDNEKLVKNMALRYIQHGCALEDLMAEGNIGLCEAIEKFDPSRGVRLKTYASWWIKQYLRKALTENCRTIKIPICQQKTVRQIHATAAKLTEITGYYPSDDEIADEIGISSAKVQNLRNLTVPMISLNSPIGDHTSREVRTYEDILSDQSGAGESPLESLSKKNGDETIHKLLSARLNKKEQLVINLRFGLNGENEMTLEEVGLAMKLTRERIRQIQDQALKKLKRTLTAEKKQETTLLSLA